MLQITYISTARPELPARAIDDILAKSRRNNEASGLTGLLLYDGYHFLQALEGETASVCQAYDRLKADPRHRALVLLSSQQVRERAFGDSAMAAQRVRIAGGATVAELVHWLTDDMIDAQARDLFRGFAHVRIAA